MYVQSQAAVPRLRTPAHRMEVVGTCSGITWINDSKATNIEAASVGIGGLQLSVVVLLGAVAKVQEGAGLGSERLAPLLKHRRGVVVYGRAADKIVGELEEAGCSTVRLANMVEAV